MRPGLYLKGEKSTRSYHVPHQSLNSPTLQYVASYWNIWQHNPSVYRVVISPIAHDEALKPSVNELLPRQSLFFGTLYPVWTDSHEIGRTDSQTDFIKHKSPHSRDAVSRHHQGLTWKRYVGRGLWGPTFALWIRCSNHWAISSETFSNPQETWLGCRRLDVWYFSAVLNSSRLKGMVIEKYCSHLCRKITARLFRFIWTHYLSITMVINQHPTSRNVILAHQAVRDGAPVVVAVHIY